MDAPSWFGQAWAGWRAPEMPLWMSGLGELSCVATLALGAMTGKYRPALFTVLAYLFAQALGGLVTGGYYTSQLRHQAVAMALLMLPIGAVVGMLSDWSPAIRRPLLILVPLAVIVSLCVWPEGARVDYPLAKEYRFLRTEIAKLEPEARLAVRDDPAQLPPLGIWLQQQQPKWMLTRHRASA